MKKFILFLIILSTIFIFACNKSEIKHENLEEVNDDISQEEEIIPIDLQVEIKDGRIVFKSHDEMVQTLETLVNYNISSIREWEKQIGFKSLSSEYHRLSELENQELTNELETGRYKEFFSVTNNELDASLYSYYIMQILNTDGLLQIGENIGTMGRGLNIWTNESNKDKLLEALENKSLANLDDYDLITRDYFNLIPNLLESEIRSSYGTSCPIMADYLSPTISSSRPDGKRKIKGQWEVVYMTTNNANGTKNYSVVFYGKSLSHKRCCSYRTKHYYSYDLETTTFNGVVNNHTSSGTSCNNCKSAISSILLVSHLGVSQSFLDDNGINITRVWGGPSSGSGTYVHHQGMGAGRELNFICD